MSSFTEFTSIKPLPKQNKWITTNSFIYYENDDLTWNFITVPSWFEFDWCSVPLWCFRTEPRTITGCLLHDYLYYIRYNRRKADLMFLNTMKISWVSYIKRYVYYIAVRLFWFLKYYNNDWWLLWIQRKIFKSKKTDKLN